MRRARKLLLLLSLSAALTLGAAAAARADSGSGTLTPGSEACLGPSLFTTDDTTLFFGGTSNVGVKWILRRSLSSDFVDTEKLFATNSTNLSEQRVIDQTAFYRWCVKNNSGVTIDYTIFMFAGVFP
jgi:hypothetical protein